MTGAAIRLPRAFQGALEAAAREALAGPKVDFLHPAGEPALVGPDSVSWRVFKNPIALIVGGVAAVILELAEPRVRTGVWDHSSFRRDPGTRLKRTGLAAMVTVYGPRSAAEAMIAGVRRAHGKVTGATPGGMAYEANDPELLNWVQATAQFGFVEAYARFAGALSARDQDRFFEEGSAGGALYGADDPPRSRAAFDAQLAAMLPKMEASPIVFEFLEIMRRAPLGVAALRPIQPLLVRAAVEITPPVVRERLGLGPGCGLRRWEEPLVRALAMAADKIVLESAPAAQASRRLGLPADHLYR